MVLCLLNLPLYSLSQLLADSKCELRSSDIADRELVWLAQDRECELVLLEPATNKSFPPSRPTALHMMPLVPQDLGWLAIGQLLVPYAYATVGMKNSGGGSW